MARRIYRVQYVSGIWVLRHNNTDLSRHIVKSEAVQTGQKIARSNPPSQLVVHRQDSTIEYEYTYGDDPFPPRG